MIKFIKSLFKPSPVIQVNNIADLFPFYDPDKFVIGVKKGTLDAENQKRFLKGEPFFFNGHPSDFVILPKSTIK
jgi:hypothetical protein